MDDKEPFVARWSRRKLEARENAPAAAPPPAPSDTPPAVPTMPAALESAPGRSPEYREFFDPQVDEKLRQAALREMFGDPHFNVMDGLDTYIDDYSKPDPIPAAMLRQLNQAKGLLLFEDEKQTDEGAAGEVAAGGGAAAAPAVTADTAALTDTRPESAAEPDAEAGTSAAAAAAAAKP